MLPTMTANVHPSGGTYTPTRFPFTNTSSAFMRSRQRHNDPGQNKTDTSAGGFEPPVPLQSPPPPRYSPSETCCSRRSSGRYDHLDHGGSQQLGSVPSLVCETVRSHSSGQRRVGKSAVSVRG